VSSQVNVVDLSVTDLILQSSAPGSSRYPNTSPPSPTLPSSPAAFNLTSPRYHRRRSSPGPEGRLPVVAPRRPEPASSHDLDQIRLDALTELQKSVVENGEGFVDKMRDWETHREREATSRRGLKRSRSVTARKTSDPVDDLDDVMALDSAPDEEAHFWEPPRKKRALLVGIVGALDAVPSETPSALTDDDTESCSGDSISAEPSSDAPPYPNIPSSHSDKAVSALALALANGGCGINDYHAVLDAHNHTHPGEQSHAGELWD
jgi:hypothetical protein